MTKEEFYNTIDSFRASLGVGSRPLRYPIGLVKALGYQVYFVPFKTPGLRGMAAPSDKAPGTIILNAKRGKRENGFVAIHEMTHCIRHIGKHRSVINCFDDPRKSQNSYYEWEANEAAAELLMPYRRFIPDVVKAYQLTGCKDQAANVLLQMRYFASSSTITYRILNLKYEIALYCSTGDVDYISLKSRKSLTEKGIDMSRYSMTDLIAIANRRTGVQTDKPEFIY